MRLVALILLTVWPWQASACGGSEDDLCEVASGAYRVALPDEAPAGAMIWLHGWGGSANNAMKNKGFRDQLTARGLAYVAPDGLRTSAELPNKNWSVDDGRIRARDDVVFLGEIVEDLVTRHGIDRDRILLAGFSRGGSMVWDAACRAPGLARAYAPVAGAFWEPLQTECAGPVDLFHTHGWTDRTVPLEGRRLRNGKLIQGDVFHSLFVLREVNGCINRQPAKGSAEDGIWRREWSDCTAGRIDLMLHPGGHGIPRGWLKEALDWFEARVAEDCLADASLPPRCG